MQLSDRQQGYLGLLMGMGAGSFAAVIVRMTQGAGMGSIAIAAGRLGIAALLLMPFALRTSMPEMRALNGRQWRLILVAGMLMAGHFATFISALEYTSVLSTVVFSATAPFFAAFIGWLARGRRPASAIWIGIGLAMVGTVLVAAGGDTGNPPTRSDPLLGNTLALCGAFLISAYLSVGQEVRENLNTAGYSMLVFGIASLWLLLVLPLAGQSLANHTPQAYLWLITLALVAQLVGHGGWNLALGGFSATLVSMGLLMVPVTSTVVAAIFLAEIPTVLAVMGGSIIIAGLWVAVRGRR